MSNSAQQSETGRAVTVTLKLSRLVNARQALQLLMTTPLPAAISLRLSRLSRAAQVELKAFDEQRDGLLKKFGRSTDGQNYEFENAEQRADFNREMEALGAEEVHLPAVTVALADLGSREVPPALFDALDWIFPEFEESAAGGDRASE